MNSTWHEAVQQLIFFSGILALAFVAVAHMGAELKYEPSFDQPQSMESSGLGPLN